MKKNSSYLSLSHCHPVAKGGGLKEGGVPKRGGLKGVQKGGILAQKGVFLAQKGVFLVQKGGF